MRVFVALLVLSAMALFWTACTREVPVTVEVTREVPVTVGHA